MKVLTVATSDLTGGAAKAAYRLHRALLDSNIDAQMLVQNKESDDFTVISSSSKFRSQARAYLDTLPNKLYKNRSKTAFSANPLAMASSKVLLEYLSANKSEIYISLNKNGEYIKNSINKYCIDNNISLRIIGIGSMIRLVFTDKFVCSRKDRDSLEIPFKKQGIFVNSNRIIFLSMAHDKAIVEVLKNSLIETIKHFNDNGFFK